MSPRRLLPLVCLAAAASSAHAQPGAEPTPPSPPPAPADASAVTYDRAFAALTAGDLAGARAGFDEVARTTADPARRAAASELVRLVDALVASRATIVVGGPPVPPAPAPAAYHEDPDEGRTEVIVTTTLSSLYAGVVAIDLTDVDDVRAGTAIITGATALGFVASLYGSRGRTITDGTADAYSLGITLGGLNALLLAEPLGAESSEAWQTGILAGMAVTGAAGFVYGHATRPTPGQVSFTGTLATLGIASSGLGLIVTAPDVEADTVLLTMTAGLDIGAAAGLALGGDLDWSPGRARLVWLGSLLGGLGGAAAGILVTGTDVDGDDAARLVAGTTLAGVWTGFGLSAHLTRKMRPDPRFLSALPDAQVVPIAVERGAGLGVAGRF